MLIQLIDRWTHRTELRIARSQIARLEMRANELQELLSAKVIELDSFRKLAEKPTRKSRVVKLAALDFWKLHGQAVDAIRSEYGDNWKIKAPFGKTELAIVRHTTATTERGTKLRWPADQRIPAAEFWPDQVIPEGVAINPDYPRVSVSPKLVRQLRSNRGGMAPFAGIEDEKLAAD